jgi:hypothetical protein
MQKKEFHIMSYGALSTLIPILYSLFLLSDVSGLITICMIGKVVIEREKIKNHGSLECNKIINNIKVINNPGRCIITSYS